MGVRAHMAMKGAHAGRMVPCPARIRCRVQRMSDHITFADRESLDAYNELESLDDAAARETMSEPEYSELAFRLMDHLRQGKSIDEWRNQFNLITPVLRDAADSSWGGNTGLSSSSPDLGDNTIGGSSWTMMNQHESGSDNVYGSSFTRYASYGDGNTLITVARGNGYDPNLGSTSDAVVTVRFRDMPMVELSGRSNDPNDDVYLDGIAGAHDALAPVLARIRKETNDTVSMTARVGMDGDDLRVVDASWMTRDGRQKITFPTRRSPNGGYSPENEKVIRRVMKAFPDVTDGRTLEFEQGYVPPLR